MVKITSFLKSGLLIIVLGFVSSSCTSEDLPTWGNWYRPAENPVFNTETGNNHDAILFVDTTLEYPYHLVVSGTGCATQTSHHLEKTFLWRTKNFSWSSDSWELISDSYNIGCQYEYDDGVKVNGKYFIYENGIVYTYTGDLEQASGKWKKEGTFPVELADDVGVFYEDGVFHLFGEFGDYPGRPDGTSLAHLTSHTGLGEWVLHDSLAVDANPNGGKKYGVGDPTIIKIKQEYYLYCDFESEGVPYKIMAWKSSSLYNKFEMLGISMEARSDQTKNWDNERVQDGDVAYIPEIDEYVMICNMRDTDGNPGGNFPTLKGFTRVVGFFYSKTGGVADEQKKEAR